MADQLTDLHLADLHERAERAGISGYRKLRREQLIEALEGGDDEGRGAAAASEPRPESSPKRGRRGGRGRSRGGRRPAADTDEPDTDELPVTGTVLDDSGPVEVGAGADGEKTEDAPTEEARGVLDLTRQRFGFLRLDGLTPADGDVYVSAAQVRRCELRPGDEVAGPAREPRRGERHRALVHVDTVNGAELEAEASRPEFDDLAPDLPGPRVLLDVPDAGIDVRAVDLLAPLALGQRVLIRAAPRSGRTTLLRSLARAAVVDEQVRVVVLLIDERREEVPAWREALPTAEFAIATSDLAPVEQLRIAELATERARRLAESGANVVLVCDSLSRVAVAAGGVDEVKRLFGTGRNLAGGGSVTVLATTLADGSDEGAADRAVITTESSLITLDPELAAAGHFPALKPAECRVSNEDALRTEAELEAARRLRSLLADLDPVEASRWLRERVEGSKTNAELLADLT